jgi:hypothetical protein
MSASSAAFVIITSYFTDVNTFSKEFALYEI